MCGAELHSLPDGVQRVARVLQDKAHPHMPVMLDGAGHVGMGVVLQHTRHTLHTVREGMEFCAAHLKDQRKGGCSVKRRMATYQPRRFVRIAFDTRECGSRPRAWLMYTPASISASRSMPVSIPMPCSM